MEVFISRHRITYTPAGGEPIVLLAPLELEDAEPSFSGSPSTQVDELILAKWASHHSRGNVNASLSWDRYVPTTCREQAQAQSLELWKFLHEHPEGELLVETAFLGAVSSPLVSWALHATLSSADVRELDVLSSPFDRPGYHASITFMVSFS